MHLSRLTLVNFKNYVSIDVDFDSHMNCFIGNNGVGKTNILDAIYYLSFCKSCFNLSDSQNILHGNDYFAIHGKYTPNPDEEKEYLVSCVYKSVGGKNILFNKKKYQRYAEHIGKIPLVIISPYDQELIYDGSEIRRKFLDGIISQIDKSYLETLINYQKVLEQRNRLLKDFAENRYFDEVSLGIWDEQLVRFGVPIHEKRKVFLSDFSSLFEEFYNQISSSNESVSIAYESQLNDAYFAEQLSLSRMKDLHIQHTSIGTHKDDLVFKINDYPIKRIGSQGQQKSFSLALKLANFEYLKQHTGVKPLLLLDDIFDKLDAERVQKLISLVCSDRFGQVFLTDTQHDRVQRLFEQTNISHKIFNVKENQLMQL